MDINNLLKNVNNVDEYISVTQELSNKYKNTKVHINITTVLALKKIRSLEIEYLNKCYENGGACVILERLLSLPPSKTWGVLGKELVSLLQYWLEAIRKYLINHSVHWWSFLKLILKFIKEIRLKDPTIPNMLVELTTECLFDIASRDKVDAQQRHEILHYLNMFCAESSREIRFALRNKFGGFFTKLGAQLSTSGYLPSQYSTLEALVRWLVPRQDLALRSAAAERWFPQDLCPEVAREIFLRTKWMDFYQDARDFLNALNVSNGLVTSVVCRRLTVGNILIISGAEKHDTWLDINSSGNSVTVLLDPKVLGTFGVTDHRTFETLVIVGDNTQSANLHNESQELTLSLNTFSPPRVQPSDLPVGVGEEGVNIVISGRADLARLDAALRGVFADKYHLLMDLNSQLSSPPRSREPKNNRNCSEEDTRLSHPVEVKRRKHYGYLARSANPGGLVSPSTVSTSSLAQLQYRLAALPRFKCDKKIVSVCAQPQLSSVTEISEAEDRSFQSISTLKLRSYGAGVCCYTGPLNKSSRKKAESDSEVLNLKTPLVRCISPVTHDKNSNSCLQAASDDSVIIDTVERLSKNKGLNIVDLLARDAFQAIPVAEEKNADSAINSGEAKSREPEANCEAIENTPIQDGDKQPMKSKVKRKKICTVISKSTTDDESNTEAINETPVMVNPKKVKVSRRKSVSKAIDPKITDKQSFNVHAVEEFFSQNFTETKAGDILISPTLARKMNESSSECSENFDENVKLMSEDLNTEITQFEFSESEIIECLNDMVDKVCIDFEKCSNILNKNNELAVCKNKAGPKDNQKAVKETNAPIKQTDLPPKPKRNIKLTYKTIKEKKPRVVTKKRINNNELKRTKNMTTIIEKKDEDILEVNSSKHKLNADVAKIDSPIIIQNKNNIPFKKTDEETPVMKRKRKLYSPKDDEIDKEKEVAKWNSEIDEDDIALSELKTYKRIKSPKTTAVCYKEIEKERKKYIHPRSKKGRGKIEESPSPRTLKMNAVFEKLKTTVESNDIITIANKKTTQSDIYNFTSESEDEDFKKKKIEVRKRISTTNTICSFDSAKCTRRGRKKAQVNYAEKSSNEEAQRMKPARKKKTVKKSNDESEGNLKIEPVISLVDERMRDGSPKELNTSIVIEKPKKRTPAEVELVLHEPPQMEPITNDQETTKSPIKRKLNRKIKKPEKFAIHKENQSKNDELKVVSDKEDDRTVSPLPGLVVESMMPNTYDLNESVTTEMIQNFKKIYKDGPDLIDESSNTQNLILSDIERCNHSPQNVLVNITDEIVFVDYNQGNTEGRNSKTIKLKKTEQYLKSSQNKKTIKTECTNPRGENVTGEVIEITDIPRIADVKSEKSIATDGITAHGDYDEAPPSPEMIRKSMQPREIEDLNDSMKDYFVKLNREIYKSPLKVSGDRSNSTENIGVNEVCRPTLQSSPSFRSDISKWLPSRRTSETDSSVKSSPKVPDIFDIPKKTKSNTYKSQNDISESTSVSKATQKHNTELKSQQDTQVSSSSEVGSAIVPVGAISLDDFDKWLPMPKKVEPEDTHKTGVSLRKENSLKLVYNTRQQSKLLKDMKSHDVESAEANYKRVNPRNKFAVTGKTKSNTKATTTNTNEHDFSVTCRNTKTTKNTKDTFAKRTKSKMVANAADSDSGSHFKQFKDKSSHERISTVISPVKSFKNFINDLHDEDDPYGDRSEIMRDMFTEQRFGSKTTNKESSISSVGKSIQDVHVDSVSKRNKTPKQDFKRLITRSQVSKSTEVKTMERELTVSTRKDESFKCPMKRKSSPLRSDAKKMKFPANDTITVTSGPSIGSVNDWFKRMEPSRSCANDTTLPFSDIVHNIMEKLDTTLPESNKNTSKKFVNLFVKAQKQLVDLQEERRKMYKSVATDIITKMVAVMDEKFVELNKRSQEMDTEFREQLKKQAFDLIREDCDQKRAMVCLLKEDVQAVLDHIERSRTESE